MPSDLLRVRGGRTSGGRICLIVMVTAVLTTASRWSAAEPPAPGAASTNTDWKLPPDERAAVESLGRVLVEAINTASEAERLRLIRAAYDERTIAETGAERIAGQLKSISERFPGLAFDRAELTEHQRGEQVSRALHVYARQPNDKLWRDLQVYVSSAKPWRLDKLVFIAEVSEPIALPNGEITDTNTLSWLNEYMDRLARDYDLSGSLLIAVGDRVIIERCFGYADAAQSRLVTAETLFSLASASKMFTAVGIARLVADGKLSYSDPIEKYLPEFAAQGQASGVTVGHLLSHSSGIAEYWTAESAPRVREAASTRDLLPLVLEAGRAFEPGAKHAYSNSNFVVAGLILERVTGKPFEQFAAETIFLPLGMTHTGYFEAADSSRPIAQSLAREGDRWTVAPRTRRGTAAGGCYSTARDMLRFVRGLNSGAIVRRETLAEMVRSKVAAGREADSDYGYGFLLQQNARVDSYGHGGIARGMNAEVRYFPSLDVTLVLLNNQDNGAYDDLRRNCIRLITGER